MPVYEFYCPECHRIFNFLPRRVDTTRRPDCPRCGRPALERQLSLFAVSRRRPEKGGGGTEDDAGVPDLPDIDEARLERAMESLAAEAEGLNEDDPRQAAQLMRKLYGAIGVTMGDGMEEAVSRMEAGEDPEAIEAELGDILENEDPFGGATGGGGSDLGARLKDLRRRYVKPQVDDTLYEL